MKDSAAMRDAAAEQGLEDGQPERLRPPDAAPKTRAAIWSVDDQPNVVAGLRSLLGGDPATG